MGIKQLYNDNLRKLPNEYGDVSVMPNSLDAAHIVDNICIIFDSKLQTHCIEFQALAEDQTSTLQYQ